MLTYQDFIEKPDVKTAIKQAVDEYRGSERFKRAQSGQNYYARKNEAIIARMSFLERKGIPIDVTFHKLRNGFFPFFVKQLSQYLLGNGVTLPENIKNKLGPRFDWALKNAGLQALVDGVAWGFWNQPTKRIPYEHLLVFRATEFVPLFDEITADLRAGIRWTQIDLQKPIVYELFTEDGITSFRTNDNGTEVVEIGRQAYKRKVRRDGIGEEVVDTENYPTIPVFPLYANELRESEFTDGIKAYVDAYDFVASDQVDQITTSEGIHWIVKNYGGEDFQSLFDKLQGKIFPAMEETNQDVSSHVVEAPFQAKQTTLAWLRKQLFSDAMALDVEAIQGGSLTNVAINVAKTNLDLKADLFEWQVSDFVMNILTLLGINEEPKFKRRTITNDSEIIANISTILSDGYADEQWAVENCPLIADVDQEDLLDRLALAEQEESTRTFPLDNQDDSGQEDEEE